MGGPLSGIKIIDFSSVLMGPYATQIMGDHGADVIKIETLDGDNMRWVGPCHHPGMGPLFLAVNRNKRSVAVNLKTDKGKEFLHKLLITADVLIHNLRPASMERLGFSYEKISRLNPGIIYCGVYGYGEDGPYAGRPAYDDLIQGACAIPSLVAKSSGQEPRYVPLTIADRTVGLNAVFSVSMALFSRSQTGKGQRIDLPMFETMASMILADHLYGETFSPPLGTPGYGRLLSKARRPYRTKDGYICALVYNDGQWERFLDHIGRADLKTDARFKNLGARTVYIDEVYDFLGNILLKETTENWLEIFQYLDIPATPLHTLESLLEDPHLQETGFFEWAEHPTEGRIRRTKVPAKWSFTNPEHYRDAPVLGQHSIELMEEVGYTPEEIEQFIEKRIIFDGRLSNNLKS
jgi:crotonobetainyl-CoA:carnitine CoA-transferase CaiB-like acyl-CoA transferase